MATRRGLSRHRYQRLLLGLALACLTLVGAQHRVRAQGVTPGPTGAPPPDPSALVQAPKPAEDLPDVSKPADGTTVSLSAGGQLATGNSRLLAGTVNGSLESRFSDNGIGASILGNYGQGAPPSQQIVETAENLQGRLRYERYYVDRASVFLLVTGRHDRFQGLDFRLNLDPGFKYMLRRTTATSLWAEAGYDFQYDVRRPDALTVLDANNQPVLDSNGNPE